MGERTKVAIKATISISFSRSTLRRISLLLTFLQALIKWHSSKRTFLSTITFLSISFKLQVPTSNIQLFLVSMTSLNPFFPYKTISLRSNLKSAHRKSCISFLPLSLSLSRRLSIVDRTQSSRSCPLFDLLSPSSHPFLSPNHCILFIIVFSHFKA